MKKMPTPPGSPGETPMINRYPFSVKMKPNGDPIPAYHKGVATDRCLPILRKQMILSMEIQVGRVLPKNVTVQISVEPVNGGN